MRILRSRLGTVAVALAFVGNIAMAAAQNGEAPGATTQTKPAAPVTVVFETELGNISMEVDVTHAPITAQNFLKYVDGKFYDGGLINRSVRKDNTTRHDIEIEVIQFQSDAARRDMFPRFRWNAPRPPVSSMSTARCPWRAAVRTQRARRFSFRSAISRRWTSAASAMRMARASRCSGRLSPAWTW